MEELYQAYNEAQINTIALSYDPTACPSAESGLRYDSPLCSWMHVGAVTNELMGARMALQPITCNITW